MLTVLLGGQQAMTDPVMKARAERAAAQGIREQDLPPVPKSILEPPPLPPPETHLKDTRRYRRPKRSKSKKSQSSKAKGAPKAAKSHPKKQP